MHGDNIIIIIIIIIIALLYYILLLGTLNKWRRNNIIQRYYNYVSPFDKKFYVQDKPSTIIFGAINDTFSDKLSSFIKRTDSDIIKYEQSENDLIKQLNNGHIDIIIVLEESIKQNNIDNILFVASLGKAEINILANNNSMLYYLSDVKKHTEITYLINAVAPDSYHYKSCVNLLNYLKIKNYTFVYGNTKADIYYIIDSHPSALIRNLTDAIPLHFIGIPEVNNGNPYMYTDDEYFFYYNNLQYQKNNMFNQRLFELYPKIFLEDINDIYTHTLKTKYIILTNTQLKNNPKKNYMINRYLQFIIYNLKIKQSPFYTNVMFESLKLMTPPELNINNMKLKLYSST